MENINECIIVGKRNNIESLAEVFAYLRQMHIYTQQKKLRKSKKKKKNM